MTVINAHNKPVMVFYKREDGWIAREKTQRGGDEIDLANRLLMVFHR
jgi:hypothetical protein